MNKLKRSLSLRSSKRRIPESVRPQIWENDSYKVRNGGVSFPVKVRIFTNFQISFVLSAYNITCYRLHGQKPSLVRKFILIGNVFDDFSM